MSLLMSIDGTALFIQMRCTVLTKIESGETTFFFTALKLSYQLIQMYFFLMARQKYGLQLP